MANLTAHAVRDLIIDRLVAGIYPLGSQLPTSRELAAEIGAHRNTIAKAYNLLADLGVVTVKQGRGTFVVALPEEGNGRPLTIQLQETLAGLMLKARRIGLPEDELRGIIERQIAASYRTVRRGAFAECNQADLHAGIAEIELATGVRLAPLLLQTIEADAARAVDGYAVVFTSLFHLKELSERLGPTRPDVDVTGIYTQPDEGALDEIARIRPGSCVGIVVSNSDGARRFASQINTVTTASTKALVRPNDDDILDLVREVDIVVCSRSRIDQVLALDLPLPVIELKFHVSRQSAGRVVDALMHQPAPTLATANDRI